MIIAMPIPATDAHCLEPEGAVGRAQPVHQGAGDPGAGHAERMPDGDGAAVHVELVDVDAQVAVAGDDLSGERLVDLHEIHVVDRHPGPRQRLPGRLDRPVAHQFGREPGDTGGDDPGQRRHPEVTCLDVAHDHQGGRAVVQRARVARR